MWALGVIIIELYLKTNNIFDLKIKEKENVNNNFYYFNQILSFFEIDEKNKNKNENLNILIKNIFDGKINPKFKIEKFTNDINDPEAIELINNLLAINPTKRFSAIQVLKSNYLKDFIGLDSLVIEPKNFSLNYNEKNSKYIKIDELLNSIKIDN